MGLSQAPDDVLTLILPPVESATLSPVTTVDQAETHRLTVHRYGRWSRSARSMRRSPCRRAPHQPTYSSAGALPQSWQNGANVGVEFPDGLWIHCASGIQRQGAAVGLQALRSTFTVPNDGAPDGITAYALTDPSLATLVPRDRFAMQVRHQNLAGSTQVTNSVNVSGLGGAIASGQLIVCNCSGAVLAKRLTSGATIVAPGATVTYEIVATNTTQAAIAGITITDELKINGAGAGRNAVAGIQPRPRTITARPCIGTGALLLRDDREHRERSGFVAVQPPPVVVSSPAGDLIVSEMVLAPLRDWNDSAGGNGVPFDFVPGTGIVDGNNV